MKKDKKDAILRARFPIVIADKVSIEAKSQGVLNVSDYLRVAVLEKLSRDTGKTIPELLER